MPFDSKDAKPNGMEEEEWEGQKGMKE